MTKRQRLDNLETRIGQLEVHIGELCPIPPLAFNAIAVMPESKLDAAIAKRLAWLKKNNEKKVMGRGRY